MLFEFETFFDAEIVLSRGARRFQKLVLMLEVEPGDRLLLKREADKTCMSKGDGTLSSSPEQEDV